MAPPNQNLEKKLGFKFRSPVLLEQALVHRSYLNEHPDFHLGSNERLEFLGDAVLELIVSLLLYRDLPDYPEGKLTDIRSCLVRTESLAEFANILDLGEHLLLSRGEEDLGGRKNTGLMANTFEAVTGAIYLDQDLETARRFALPFLKKKLKEIIAKQSFKDSKSLFQEKVQEREKITPRYAVVSETGPDHQKTFTVGLWVGETLWAEGHGRSKQEAEEEAAQKALEKISKKN